MATYTDNYQLTLPTYAEVADIATINNNMTKIDDIMHSSQISMATAYDATRTSENPYNTGDVVMYELIAYRCKEDGVYGTWDATKWEQTTLADNLGGGGSDVEANPSGTPSTDLTKLGINGTIYSIPSGDEVEANPSGTSSTDLTKLGINGTVYNIPSGGGGTTVVANPSETPTDTLETIQIGQTVFDIVGSGGSRLTDDIIYQSSTDESTIILTESLADYDYIYIKAGYTENNTDAIITSIFNAQNMVDSIGMTPTQLFGIFNDAYYLYLTVTSNTQMTRVNQRIFVKEVRGLKFTGGSTVTITPETIAEPKQKIADFEIDGESGSLYAPIVEIEGYASGAIATFTDGGNNKPLKSLKVAINPVQASGTPSPENPIPIYGWTGASLNVNALNFCNEIWESGSINGNTGAEVVNADWSRTGFLPIKGGQSYYFYCQDISSANGAYIFQYRNDKSYITGTAISGNLSFTPSSGCYFVRIQYKRNINDISNYDVALNYPSTVTSYEPYNGTTYTIPFEDSQGNPLIIYGGKVHIRRVNGEWSGEVVETEVHALISDLNLTRSKASSWSGYLFYSDISNKSIGSSLMCSSYKYSNHGTTTVENLECIRSANTSYIYFRDDSYSDVETFKQGNEGQEIVYELATPNTYPIDPANIPNIVTLLDDNNMFADTGDIDEVIYIRDLNLAFNELWDLVHSNSGTRSLSLSKSAVKEEETKEEPKEEEKEEEETKEEQR